MSQLGSRSSNTPHDDKDNPLMTAMLAVAVVFIKAAVVVLSYYLKSWYNVYLWDF